LPGQTLVRAHLAASQSYNLHGKQKVDVVCIQEPLTCLASKTSTHPGYNLHAPVTDWGHNNPVTREALCPWIMIYVRKDYRLKSEVLFPRIKRDLLWVKVNGFSILNAYHQPVSTGVLQYITNCTPPPLSIVGSNLNARHPAFKPGTDSRNGSIELNHWSIKNNMSFIGEPGKATHQAGHVLDLTISNIPFATTEVVDDPYCSSDYFTLLTTIPARGRQPLDQFHYRVLTRRLHHISALVELHLQAYPIGPINTKTDIDSSIASLEKALWTVLKGAGTPDRAKGHLAP
jgi:hypothetical protein